jgi:putative addiction module killer protein
MVYACAMTEMVRSETFNAWLTNLRDRQARIRILERITRLATGNPGQYRALTGGVRELKIDFGPGYRLYYLERGAVMIVLLCGGDKSTQQQDIELALKLAKDWE